MRSCSSVLLALCTLVASGCGDQQPIISTSTVAAPSLAVFSRELKSAVESESLDDIQSTLNSGALIAAIDDNKQNALHWAAKDNKSFAMRLLLQSVKCKDQKNLLVDLDAQQSSAFSLALRSSKGLETLVALVDFMLANRDCQDLIDQELHTLVQNRDEALPNLLSVLANRPMGVEKLATALLLSAGSTASEHLSNLLTSSLGAETRHNILARAYYKALHTNDDVRTKELFKLVVLLGEKEQKQIVGYMLFINSSNNDKEMRSRVLEQAERLHLNPTIFKSAESEVADLKAKLDAVVIGQESAKISLSVAIKNHYKRLKQNLKKSNLLIIGPSGTGKTFMVQTIADSLDVPFTVADASSITQAGYIGGKVKDAVSALAQKAEYNQERIEQGIIFFDEIDKMAGRSGRADSEEFKRQAQATLLKVIEGIEIEIPRGEGKMTVDTSKILFICAGAFTGLSDIIDARLKREGRVASENIFNQVATEDLVGYGMAPELLGRLPNVIALHELRVIDLYQILKTPKSSVLEEHRQLLKRDNIDLRFTDGAILAIAQKASEFKVGARALKTVVEQIMSDLQFRLGNMGDVRSCTITERVVRYGDMPLIEYTDGLLTIGR